MALVKAKWGDFDLVAFNVIGGGGCLMSFICFSYYMTMCSLLLSVLSGRASRLLLDFTDGHITAVNVKSN